MSEVIALFPLSQLVLPQGRMQLRIFENRYQRLVREAGQRPFASALLNPYVHQQHPERVFPVVTLVNIIDFQQLSDGLLGITIEGVERRRIHQRWQETDKLHVAITEQLPQWPALPLPPENSGMAEALRQIYQQNPALAALYPAPDWQNACWLAQRWLEILRMPAPLKYELISALSAQPAFDVLTQWLGERSSWQAATAS